MQNKLNQLTQQIKSLELQNKQLVEKNQNDLIMIRQRQAAFKKAQQSIDNERNNFKIVTDKLQLDNNYMRLEIDKLKTTLAKLQSQKNIKEQSNQLEEVNIQLKDEIKRLTDIINKQKNKNAEYVQSLMILQNQRDSIKQQLQGFKKDNGNLQKNIDTLSTEVVKLSIQKEQLQLQLKLQIQQLQQQQILPLPKLQMYQNFTQTQADNSNDEDNQKNLKQIEKLNQHIKLIQSRLRQTNQILKTFDLKNKLLIEENHALKRNTLALEDAILKHKSKLDEQRRKIKENLSISNIEGNSRTKELEQQNKLLKQMLKSVQTMIHIRESETERYKFKTEVAIQSHRGEPKASVRKFEDVTDRPRLPKIPQTK